MSADQRRQQVIDCLAKQGFVDLATLTSELGVSESTVRRDLTQLEAEGLVRRTHGGAVMASDRYSTLSFAVRETSEVAEKSAIGRAAAALVNEDETVLIDGGTTTYQVARHLTGRRIQVVTNSLPIANLLGSDNAVELVMVGGFIYPRTGVALGPLTMEMLGSIHANKVYMGCAGITDDAVYNHNSLLAEAQRKMVESADEVVFVVDHTKFGRRALAQIMKLDDVDAVVSDERLDASWQGRLAERGVRLVVATGEESARRVKEEAV